MNDKSSTKSNPQPQTDAPQSGAQDTPAPSPFAKAEGLLATYNDARSELEKLNEKIASAKATIKTAKKDYEKALAELRNPFKKETGKKPSGTELGDVKKNTDNRVLLLAKLVEKPLTQSEVSKAIDKAQGNINKHWKYLLEHSPAYAVYVTGDSGPAKATEDGKKILPTWQAMTPPKKKRI